LGFMVGVRPYPNLSPNPDANAEAPLPGHETKSTNRDTGVVAEAWERCGCVCGWGVRVFVVKMPGLGLGLGLGLRLRLGLALGLGLGLG